MSDLKKECPGIREFLMDFLDGRLPWFNGLKFRFHILRCKSCRGYLRRYSTSVKLFQNILDDPPPDELVNLTLDFLDRNTKLKDAEWEDLGEQTP